MSDEAVYHHAPKSDNETKTDTVEQSDRGLFDFMGKKDEEKKCEETAISSEFEKKAHVSEPEPKSEEKKESLLAKLHRSDSSSSSVSFYLTLIYLYLCLLASTTCYSKFICLLIYVIRVGYGLIMT